MREEIKRRKKKRSRDYKEDKIGERNVIREGKGPQQRLRKKTNNKKRSRD